MEWYHKFFALIALLGTYAQVTVESVQHSAPQGLFVLRLALTVQTNDVHRVFTALMELKLQTLFGMTQLFDRTHVLLEAIVLVVLPTIQ